jgi:hypothetical protein
MDLAAELAREGLLSSAGTRGMLTSGIVVLEFVGADDGDEWHSILGLPTERFRDQVVHLELLRRYVEGAEWVDADG